MRQFYMNNWGKVVESMGTSIHKGLMEYDCIVRREQFGDNSITLPEKEKIKNLIRSSFDKYSVLLSIVIFTFLFITKSFLFLGIWTIVTLINYIFKVLVNLNRIKKANILHNINSTDVLVLREGIERIVKSEELVKGDIVIFKKGSFIAADIRIISGNGILVDENNITGDKLYSQKNELKLFKEPSRLCEIENMLFRGTIIKEGIGTGIVVQTGNETILGKLYSSMKYNTNKENIYKVLESQIIKIQVILFIFVALIYILIPGEGEIKKNIVSGAVFSISTSLIAVYSFLYHKKNVKELSEKDIVVNDISAIKNSSSVKVLFLEKSGSITREEMVVEKFYTNEAYLDSLKIDINEINTKRLLEIAFINTDIYGEKKSIDDIYGKAYEDFMKEKNINKAQVVRQNLLKFRVPFESDKKIITSVVKNYRGYRANSRGNLEDIINRCTYILINGVERPITQSDIEKAKLADLYFSRYGLVTEAFAYRSFNYEPTSEENVESNLVFVGLVALENLLIEGVRNDIEEAFEEGVLPIIICEDNKILAEVIGRKIGLLASSNEVTSGVELSYMSQEEFYKAISRTRVYCRITPSQKEKIVLTYIKDGFKVAVEGLGLGDVTTVTSCNLGISTEKAPKLLKNISDITTSKSSIKTLLELRKYGKKENEILEYGSFLYLKILMSIIVAAFSFYLFKGIALFNDTAYIIMNLLLITPTICTAIVGCKVTDLKDKWKKIIATFLVIIAMAYFIDMRYTYLMYTCISLISIIDILMDAKISIKKMNRDIIMIVTAIFLIICSNVIIYYLSDIVLSTYLFITISLFVILYTFTILIIKRWQ